MKTSCHLLFVVVLTSHLSAIANPGELWELAKKGQWAEVEKWLEDDPDIDIDKYRPAPQGDAPPGYKEPTVREMIFKAWDYLAVEHRGILESIVGPIDPIPCKLGGDDRSFDDLVANQPTILSSFGSSVEPVLLVPVRPLPRRPVLANPPPPVAAQARHNRTLDQDDAYYEESLEEPHEKPAKRARAKADSKKDSSVNGYKKKRYPEDSVGVSRLNDTFISYLSAYTRIIESNSQRFATHNHFVFAVLLLLGAETNAVTYGQIYEFARTMRNRMPETLAQLAQAEFRAAIRSALYAGQLFVREAHRKTWRLRGRSGAETIEAPTESRATPRKRERKASSKPSKNYKKKRNVQGDASDDINTSRLNEMFTRYLQAYERVERGEGTFEGTTELAFAILFELDAESKPVSLEAIYAKAAELQKTPCSEKLKQQLRGAFLACQLFVRGDSRGSWQLRGRPQTE